RTEKMDKAVERRVPSWTRIFAWTLAIWVMLACLASAPVARAAEDGAHAAAVDEEPNFFVQVLSNLFNSRELMRILGQPKSPILAFVALNLIVFVETGLLIGFFLPGDSLLVAAGVVAYGSGWNIPLLLVTLSMSAIIGDSVGYAIGYKTGPRIFN